eukprot:8945825-Pyramimonas_sp.AAC.1
MDIRGLKGGGTDRGGNGNPDVTCHNCGKKSHMKKECWQSGGGASQSTQRPKGKGKGSRGGKGKGQNKDKGKCDKTPGPPGPRRDGQQGQRQQPQHQAGFQ